MRASIALVSIVLTAVFATGCVGTTDYGPGPDGKYPYPVYAEEIWCDRKITEIDRVREKIVTAYDADDKVNLLRGLEEINTYSRGL